MSTNVNLVMEKTQAEEPPKPGLFVDAWAPIQVSIERDGKGNAKGGIRWDILLCLTGIVIVVSGASRVVAGTAKQAA